MGVNGLWEIVEPTQQPASFRSLAARNGFERNYRDFPMLRIGVDAGAWIAAASAASGAGTPHSKDEHAVVKNFMYRLCRLLDVPATFIFVYDGPARPAVKRGKRVFSDAPWATKYAHTLIQDFGFYPHQAPGEAEAELAELNKRGYIDAIVSNDGDTLVFGALNVIRINMPSSADPDIISVYHSDIIEHADEVNLTRAGLAFYALCAGGDYSSGIRGCGPHIAYALAKGGFGDQLVSSLALEPRQFYCNLATWRDSIRYELRFNARGLFMSKHPSVADAIMDTFPDLAILNLYLHPTTSFTLGIPPPLHMWTWIPQLPNLLRLSSFCINHFGWDHSTTLKRFRDKLWRGVALRLCTFPLTIYTQRNGCLMAADLSAHIIKISGHVPGDGRIVEMVKLRLSTTGFVSLMGPEFRMHADNSIPINVEIPRLVFDKLKINAGRSRFLPGVSSVDIIELTDSEMEELEVASIADDIIELD